MKYGYMILTDHFNNELDINHSVSGAKKLNIKENFPDFFDDCDYQSFKKVTDLHSSKNPIFSYQHMKEALSLNMINELREIDKIFRNFALNCLPGSSELNTGRHIFFNQNFMFPG
ncbi:MAG: hypothetical protein HamCj_01320 [Candidatus Hamiltonella defensa (Ceratovacuna japonica)]